MLISKPLILHYIYQEYISCKFCLPKYQFGDERHEGTTQTMTFVCCEEEDEMLTLLSLVLNWIQVV